jgi:hypothetical protein
MDLWITMNPFFNKTTITIRNFDAVGYDLLKRYCLSMFMEQKGRLRDHLTVKRFRHQYMEYKRSFFERIILTGS